MKATTLAVTISVLASAGLAAVAAYDMTVWNRARAKETGMQKRVPVTDRGSSVYQSAKESL